MATTSEIEKDFKALIKRERLAQAYAFYGANIEVQFGLAKSLANFLETGSWIPASAGMTEGGQPPLLDSLCIDGRIQRLGVETMRQAGEFLYKMPAISRRRTLIISSAAELTREAQNSILKLVEEPPSHGLIILVLRDINSLLPPLRSRLMAVYLHGELSGEPQSPLEERAAKLVKSFVSQSASDRSKLIKSMVDEDSEIRDEMRGKPSAVHEEFILAVFTRLLIKELAKNPEQNVRVLKELLKRQSAMEDLSTNKRLQLEAVAQCLG